MECTLKLGCLTRKLYPFGKKYHEATLNKVFARRDIGQDEEIVNSYIDTDLPFDTRQEILQSQYEFICDCQKCLRRI